MQHCEEINAKNLLNITCILFITKVIKIQINDKIQTTYSPSSDSQLRLRKKKSKLWNLVHNH